MRRRRALAIALAALLGTRAARADGDPAAAEAAFAEARALIKDGRWEEACPKLEASLALEPAVGTLLNLGECLAKTGRTASAWLRYRDAAAAAVREDQPERERIARERANALEPFLCRIVIRAPKRPDLVVKRDGVTVDANVVGVPVPVDPGAHDIRAEADGEAPFDAHVVLRAPLPGAPCGDALVDVPFAPERRTRPAAGPTARREDEPATAWRPIHTLAVASAGTGAVALGVGAAFAISAASAKSDADALCRPEGCTPDGHDRLDEAGRRADVATVAIAAAGALLVTGVVLWIASPSLRAPPRSSSTAPFVVRF